MKLGSNKISRIYKYIFFFILNRTLKYDYTQMKYDINFLNKLLFRMVCD